MYTHSPSLSLPPTSWQRIASAPLFHDLLSALVLLNSATIGSQHLSTFSVPLSSLLKGQEKTSCMGEDCNRKLSLLLINPTVGPHLYRLTATISSLSPYPFFFLKTRVLILSPSSSSPLPSPSSLPPLLPLLARFNHRNSQTLFLNHSKESEGKQVLHFASIFIDQSIPSLHKSLCIHPLVSSINIRQTEPHY